MTTQIHNITFDCSDALVVGAFWSKVLGHELDEGATSDFASIGNTDRSPGDIGWLFASVPEPKSAKNRMHLDLGTADRGAEVARLVGLGATHVDDHDEWGVQWSVLQDPEGNEFCVAGH